MQSIRIRFESDRRYTVSWEGKIIACYELLKTKGQARLKSVYFGVPSMTAAQAMAQKLVCLLGCRVEVRPAQRCATPFEVVLRSPKVAQMPEVERFISTLIAAASLPGAKFTQQPIASKVVPLQPMQRPLVNRPDMPQKTTVKSGGYRLSIV